MYSDFYEIPLPALRFEKVEETDIKKWKRHRRETTLKEKQIHSLDEVKKPKEKMTLTTLKEKTTLTTLKEKQIHSQVNDTQRNSKALQKQKYLW